MKRRIFAFMFVVAMLAMTLVACGSDTTDTTNTTNETEVNTEVEDEVVEPTEEPTTTPEVEEVKPEYTYAETLVYPDIFAFPETVPAGMEGYTEKYLDSNYPDWAMNKTHYVDGNGNEMNFVWEGPIGLGADDCSAYLDVLHFSSKGEYYFNASTEGKITPERFDEIKTLDKEELSKLAIDEAPYIENGYYDANISDNFMTITFETEQNTFRGYSHFILDREKGLFYKFLYFELFFDETRAMDVINSINIWADYESNEVVESETPEFEYAHTWAFPEPMEGFTRKYLNDDLTEWSLNETHYVANDGTEMNFTWEGPAALGETAQSTETTVYLYSADLNYQLNAWYGGDITQEKFDKDLTFDKNIWTSFSTYNPYIVDGYYDIQTTDTTIDVVYAVSNDTQMGYAYYLVDLNYGVCYQFIYLENMEVYDDARALNVINSIAYWEEYTPLETTTE